MLQHITKYLSHYMPILGIFGLGFVGLLRFSYDPVFQSAIIISMGASFLMWVAIHHWLHEGLRMGIILEYLAVSLLGVIVLLSILWSR